MSRAGDVLEKIDEEYRGSYEVMVSPSEGSVVVKFSDNHIGNDHLRFPAVTMSYKNFFEIIPHDDEMRMQMETAKQHGDTYSVFANPWAISRLARKGVPGEGFEKFAHTHSRQEPSDAAWARHGMMTGRV